MKKIIINIINGIINFIKAVLLISGVSAILYEIFKELLDYYNLTHLTTIRKIILFIIFLTIIILILFLIIKLIIFICKIPMKLGTYYGQKVTKLVKISNIEFENNKQYYRDLIKEYSLVEFCYIDNFQINMPKDVVVVLLNMQLRGIIKLENNEIKIIDQTKCTKNIEKFVLSMIKNGKLDVIENDKYKYKFDIITDALKDNLIYKKEKEFDHIAVYFIGMSILFVLVSILIIKFENLAFLIIIVAILVAIFGINFLANYKEDSYYLTDKGSEIHKKLSGLKMFLEDFSILDERELKEIILWDDYLIYSVLFNQNSKVVEEVVEKYFLRY